MQPAPYRQMIKDELIKRKAKNPAYSLRSFAKSLGISAPLLSQLIRGQRSLTIKTGKKIAQKMRLNAKDTKLLLASFELESMAASHPTHKIDLTTFEKIVDWYHLAILEIGRIPNNKYDPGWIAQILGIDPKIADDALGRLKALHMIKRGGDGFINIAGSVDIGQSVPSQAIREFHRQCLILATKSLQNDPISERIFNGLTLAIQKKDLAEASRKIRHLQEEFDQSFGGEGADCIYQLNIQFFPVATDLKFNQPLSENQSGSEFAAESSLGC